MRPGIKPRSPEPLPTRPILLEIWEATYPSFLLFFFFVCVNNLALLIQLINSRANDFYIYRKIIPSRNTFCLPFFMTELENYSERRFIY